MSSLKAAGAVVIAIAVASKLLGVGREMLMAYFFGTSGELDAYVVGMSIPQAIMHFFMGGAFTAAFIPFITERRHREGEEAAWRSASAIGRLSILFFALLVAGAVLAAPALVRVAAPGFQGWKYGLAVDLARALFPAMLFFTVAAWIQSILNSLERFTLSSLQSVVLNIAFIAAMALGAARYGVRVLAMAFFIGSLAQVLVQLPGLRGHLHRIRIFGPIEREHVRGFFTLFLPFLLVGLFVQLNLVVDKMVASLLGDGNVAALNFSERLMEVAKSILGFSLATVIFPRLTVYSIKGSWAEFSSVLRRGVNLIFLLSLPVTLAFLIYARPIVEVLFMRGLFGNRSADLTSRALFYYAFAAFFLTANYPLIRSFYALQKVRLSLTIGGVSLVVNLVLNVTFSLLLGMGLGGITLATSASSALMFFLSVTALRREIPGLEVRSWALEMGRIALAEGTAFTAGFAVYWAAGAAGATTVAQLGGALAATGVLMIALCAAMRIETYRMVATFMGERLGSWLGRARG